MVILMALSKRKKIAYYMNDDKYYYFSYSVKQTQEIDEDEVIDDIANNDFDEIDNVDFTSEDELLAFIKNQFKKKSFWRRKKS